MILCKGGIGKSGKYNKLMFFFFVKTPFVLLNFTGKYSQRNLFFELGLEAL